MMSKDFTASRIALGVVLGLAGASIVYEGVNIAFGGIATLGLQGGTDFFAVTDANEFAAHDSHVRFLGGVWIGVGAVVAAGAARLERMRSLLHLAFALVMLGGLSRFTAMQPEVLFGPSLVSPLAAELIGVPMVWLWMARTGRSAPMPAGAALA